MRTIAALLTMLGVGMPVWGQFASLDREELTVLAAAVAQSRIRGDERWVLLADETATFSCDSGTTRMIQVGGCSGMRRRNQPIEQVLLWLRDQFPHMSDEVLADFRIKGDTPARVTQQLPMPVKQFVWGPHTSGENPAKEMGTADLAINVSSVGFNRAHTQALTYIGTASWTGADRAYGEYVFLVKATDTWSIAGRSRIWSMGK